MTISPPSNVRLADGEPARVLASGIDTLVLAIDVVWNDESVLHKLSELKAEAAAKDESVAGRIALDDGSGVWLFSVKPHGAKGYAYLLDSGEMSWQVGDWLEPKSRPSVMVAIRSETLWTHGPAVTVQRIHDLLVGCGGHVVMCKVSRVDLCVDVLMRAVDWDRNLRKHLVTRAVHVAGYYTREKRTGIQIGKGMLMARMYDKPLEIVANGSKKQWMFDVWGIESVAHDHRIIRIEFEVKREAIKTLGINVFDDLMANIPELWSYCTGQWLRLADDPKKHHTRQKLLAWWTVVQVGLTSTQEAHPLVRAKAIKADEEQLVNQLLGYLTSLVALHRQGDLIRRDEVLDMQSHLALVLDILRRRQWGDEEFTDRVKRKQAKFQRHAE